VLLGLNLFSLILLGLSTSGMSLDEQPDSRAVVNEIEVVW
jgi:hypothetical protein